MKRLLISAFFIFIVFRVSYAQVQIEGSVSPIGDNIIFIIGKPLQGNQTLAYAQVDDNGCYSLIINSPDLKQIRLIIKGLGIKTIVKVIENKSQKIDFKVEQETQKLQEVVVKASKIRTKGDTINYTAGAYLSKNDHVLKDLLKKMPGINVDDDGKIQVNGQWIKDFYIEGSNLLDDRYNIATNNINAEDIASVQILQHHQEAKMLREKEYSDQPAINIRLKKGAKGVWSSTLDGQIGGSPLARNVNFNIMKFAAKYQNLSFLKSNNIGNDLRQEIKAPTNINTQGGIGLVLPNKAPVNGSWSYLNDTHSTSINQLFKVGQDKVLSLNINYLYDNEQRESNDYRNFFLDKNQRVIFQEQNNLQNRRHYIASSINYKINTQRWYLKNTFNTQSNDSYANGDLTLTNDMIQQSLGLKKFAISNNTIIQTPAKHLFSHISSKLSFQTTKSTLKLPIIEQIFEQYTIDTEHSLSLYRTIVGNTHFDVRASATTQTENIKRIRINDNNNESMFQYGFYAVPRLSYFHPNQAWQWFIYCPIGIKGYHKRIPKRETLSGHYWSINPMLSINYKANDRLEVMATASYQENYNSLFKLLSHRYYINYYTLFDNQTNLAPLRNKSLKGTVSINYKDILHMLFANVAFTVADLRNGYTDSYRSENGKIVHQLIANPKYYQVFQVTQELSKGFYKWNSKISEIVNLGRNRQNYLIGGKNYDGYTNFLILQMNGSAQPLKNLSVSSNNKVSFAQSYIKNQGKQYNYWTLNSRNDLLLNLSNPLVLKVESEIYYNSYFSSDKLTHLFNTSLEWKLKHITFNFQCINLFNKTTYQRAIYNDVLLSVSDIRLRGRTFLIGAKIKIL